MFNIILFKKPAPCAGFVLPARRGRISLPMLARLGVLARLVPLLPGCIFSDTSGATRMRASSQCRKLAGSSPRLRAPPTRRRSGPRSAST